MYLYFIRSEHGTSKSSGTISRDKEIKTPEDYNDCIDDYKKYMGENYGNHYDHIVITQFNRIY